MPQAPLDCGAYTDGNPTLEPTLDQEMAPPNAQLTTLDQEMAHKQVYLSLRSGKAMRGLAGAGSVAHNVACGRRDELSHKRDVFEIGKTERNI